MFLFDYTMVILIPGVIFSMIAQWMVSSAYKKYSKISIRSGVTGTETAQRILAKNNISNVSIHGISGNMTDHYDSRNKSMALSGGVANASTIAAVGIAAHETGHAIQDAKDYFPLRFRNTVVPICGFATQAAWPIFFVGLLFGRNGFGGMLMDFGILLFCVALVFYIITLPVEFNASRRAVVELSQSGIVTQEELGGVKKVLTAAALTYVASTLMALLQLLRLIAIRNRD